MEIFNIGPLELLFIVLILLIVMGPKDLDNTARKLGSAIYRFGRSSLWKSLRGFAKNAQDYTTQVVRDAGLDEIQKEIESQTDEIKNIVVSKGSVEWDGKTRRSNKTVIAEEDIFKNTIAPPPPDAEHPESPIKQTDEEIQHENE